MIVHTYTAMPKYFKAATTVISTTKKQIQLAKRPHNIQLLPNSKEYPIHRKKCPISSSSQIHPSPKQYPNQETPQAVGSPSLSPPSFSTLLFLATRSPVTFPLGRPRLDLAGLNCSVAATPEVFLAFSLMRRTRWETELTVTSNFIYISYVGGVGFEIKRVFCWSGNGNINIKTYHRPSTLRVLCSQF